MEIFIKQIIKFIWEGWIFIENVLNMMYFCEVCGMLICEGYMCDLCCNCLMKDLVGVVCEVGQKDNGNIGG